MHGRRGTLQPVRAGRKSPSLFAPSRSPIETIAPQAMSIADSSVGWGGPPTAHQHQLKRHEDPAVSERREDGDPSTSTGSSSGDDDDSSSSTSSSSTSSSGGSSSVSTGHNKSQDRYNLEQQNYYALYDENADLRKQIQGLEIVLRDHGFSRDGKPIVPNVEITRIDGDQDEDGLQRSHMEMISMTGMDPERPTVLCKYMEFKVAELQGELEAMEADRDRLAAHLKETAAELSANKVSRLGKLRESKNQKRKLEEKLTTAIKVNKTRETLLTQKLWGMESTLDQSQQEKGVLLKRIQSLEKVLEAKEMDESKNSAVVQEELLGERAKVQELEEKLNIFTERETYLNDQVCALKTNLEWELEESTKREDILRDQITALEGKLGSKTKESKKREDDDDVRVEITVPATPAAPNLPAKLPTNLASNLHILASPSQVDESLTHGESNGETLGESHRDTLGDSHGDILGDSHGETLGTSHEDTHDTFADTHPTFEDTKEGSLTLEDTNLEGSLTLDDYSDSLTQADLIESTTAFHAFQQSISELSKAHNKQLEEWRRQENKEREEQLLSKIKALETNLEWNLRESKKQEKLLREQVTALENNLEWNLEDFAKKEIQLNERIAELEELCNTNHSKSNSTNVITNHHINNQNINSGDSSSNKELDGSLLTLDSLIPPANIFELKEQMDKVRKQKEKLEEYLSMVVQESTKREKNLQQIISGLESTTRASTDREEVLQTRVSDLEIQLQEQKDSDWQRLDDLEKAWVVAIKKENEKQDNLIRQVTELQGTIATKEVMYRSRQGDLLARIDELEGRLGAQKRRHSASAAPMPVRSESNRSISESKTRSKSLSQSRSKSLSKSRSKSRSKSGSSTMRSSTEGSSTDRRKQRSKSNRSIDSTSHSAKSRTERTRHRSKSNRSMDSAKSQPERSRPRMKPNRSMDSTNHSAKSQPERVKPRMESTRSMDSTIHSRTQSDRGSSKRGRTKRSGSERSMTENNSVKENADVVSIRILDLEEQLEKVTKAAFNMDVENQELSDLVADLEHELDNTREIASAARVENKGMSGRIGALEDELTNNRGITAGIRGHNKELIQKIEGLKNELEKAHETSANTRIENKDLVKRCVELKKELDMERKDKSYRNRILESTRDSASSARSSAHTLNSRIFDLERDLEQTQIAAAAARGENQELADRISELEGELERERAKVSKQKQISNNEIITDLKKELEKSFVKNKKVSTRIFELENELESARQDKFDRNKRVTKLQNDLAELAQKNEDLSHTIIELENEMNDKSDKFDHSELIEQLQADLEEAAQKQGPLSQKIADLENEVEESKQERENLYERISDLQEELEANNRSFDSMEAQNRALERDQEEAKTENERLLKRIEELTQKLEEEPSNHSAINEDATATTDVEADKEFADELESAKHEQERLSKFIVDLSNKLEEKQERMKHMPMIEVMPEMENEGEPERTERTKPERLPKAKIIGNQRRMVIAELEKEIGNRETRNELSELRNEFDEAILDHEVKKEELKSRIQALETEVEFGQHEHERLERVIFVIRNELKMAADIHEPVAARKKELEEELASSKTAADRLDEELASVKNELEAKNKDFNIQINDLKTKLKSKDHEFRHLSQFKFELEQELEATTAKVRNIEKEFESAAKTMDATYEELSVRNTKLEKELVSYKRENKYLNKFVGELQKEIEMKQAKRNVKDIPELKKKDSLESVDSDSDELDELIESERVNHEEAAQNFMDSDLMIDEDLSDKEKKSKKTDEKDVEDPSSSSEGSKKGDQKRISLEIKDTEDKLEAERVKREAIKKTICNLQDLKKKLKDMSSSEDGKSTNSNSALTAQIRESEAELEALNAHIYELEADLEGLLDEMWEKERKKEAISQEHQEELDDNVDSTEGSMHHSNSNRERLSTRILELEREMEELEDELEETIETSKDEKQALVRKNSELQAKLEATIEKAKREHLNLAVSYKELEKKLQVTIDNYRKEQQALAIHYIEKERELKQTSAKARAEEKRLNDIITNLEKEVESNQDSVKNEDEILSRRLSIILEDIDIHQKEDANEDNRPKQHSESTEESQRRKEEDIVSKVSNLKKEYESTLSKTEVLNDKIAEIQGKLEASQEKINRAKKEAKDLNKSYEELELKWNCSDEDHETDIWEAEQKMRDLIDTASLERKEKNRFKEQCSVHRREIRTLKEQNEKLSSQNELLEADENTGRDILVRRVAELEEEVRSLTAESEIDLDLMSKRVKEVQEELENSKRQNRSFSSQNESHERERKEYSKLSDLVNTLKREIESTKEETKIEKQWHLELRKRLFDTTIKNEAEKANIENRLFNVFTELGHMEEERKKYSKLPHRLAELERKLQVTVEERKTEKQHHSRLKDRLFHVTVLNEAQKANLERLLWKARSELEWTTRELRSTEHKNRRLTRDLQFFEDEKARLNRSDVDYIEDDLRSTLEENEKIIQKIQSYERGTSNHSNHSRSSRSRSPKTPRSKDRTATESTCFDEDTLPSDGDSHKSDTAKSGSDVDSTTGIGSLKIATVGSDSHDNSVSTTKAANGLGSPGSPPFKANGTAEKSGDSSGRTDSASARALPFESDEDTSGYTNPQTAPTEEQNQKIEKYLTPLIERVNKILGQELPIRVIQGIQDLLASRVDDVDCESFVWEDFETLLEEICQGFDEDTWFEIQEAFFVAWEEKEIEQMGGDLSESPFDDNEDLYDDQ